MRLRDGDILMLHLWWKRLIVLSHMGEQLSVPIWLLRSCPLAAGYVIRTGEALNKALGQRWEDSDLTEKSKAVLRKCVARGWEAKTLGHLASVRHNGWIRGIGPATKADVNRVLEAGISRAAPRPTMETRLWPIQLGPLPPEICPAEEAAAQRALH